MRVAIWVALIMIVPFATANDKVYGWRIDGQGQYLEANPPTEWSGEKNVLWKTKLPNWSNAQAILVDGRLFVNSEPNTLICVDAESGKIQWERPNNYEDVMDAADFEKMRRGVDEKAAPIRAEIEDLEAQIDVLRKEFQENRDDSLRGKMRGIRLKMNEARKKLNKVDPLNIPDKHDTNGFTSAVPISDGHSVYAIYGNGVVVGFDLDGKRKWSKIIEKPNHVWGHSAAPALSGDTLIVHILDVVALDKNTGKELWRVPAKESWGSPMVTEIGGEPVVLTAAEGAVIRIKDGAKLAETTGGLTFATPIIEGRTVYYIEGKAAAVKLPAQASDSVSAEKVWEARVKGSRHYASSVILGDLIYAVSREGWLSVLEKATGTLVYEKELGINGENTNSVYPSLSIAGDYVFIGFEEGAVLVLKPGRTYEEVARNTLEPFRGTPIFSGNRIYIRGLDHLYCLATR